MESINTIQVITRCFIVVWSIEMRYQTIMGALKVTSKRFRFNQINEVLTNGPISLLCLLFCEIFNFPNLDTERDGISWMQSTTFNIKIQRNIFQLFLSAGWYDIGIDTLDIQDADLTRQESQSNKELMLRVWVVIHHCYIASYCVLLSCKIHCNENQETVTWTDVMDDDDQRICLVIKVEAWKRTNRIKCVSSLLLWCNHHLYFSEHCVVEPW